MEPSKIRVIAYCCMILGSFFLMKSILVKSPKFVLHELLQFKVSKSRFFRRYISQKLEAIIGFVFFALGCGQLAYLELTTIDQLSWWKVGGLTVLAILLIGALLHQITRFFSGQIFVEHMRFIVLKHGYQLQNDEGLVQELGRILRVKRNDDDTVESYTDRVRTKMKLPEVPVRRGSARRPGL
ncbi:MAG: hypothetical protein ACYTGZ_08305 [Planctomycetota bacterium]|jgi:hypothetical protein